MKAKGIRHKAEKAALGVLCLLPSVFCLGVNSPRPASVSLNGHAIVIGWTNLSTAHPWIVSYKTNLAGPWLWESERIEALNGALTVTRPATNAMGMYRLWPAAPSP